MFAELLEKELNKSITENGALGFKSSGSALVDFNFKVASYRNCRKQKHLVSDFVKVWAENPEYALKYLFYLRDVRGGLGERDTFKICLKSIAYLLDERVFDWIEEYGRMDDLFVFFDTPLETKMIEYVLLKLLSDADKMVEGKHISGMAKWMPSINTSCAKTKALAKRFIDAYHITPKQYRKKLALLRKYADVLERKLCANEWDKIDYNKITSNANLKYKDAFLEHDPERRKKYLEALKNGDKSVKMNSTVLFPHDIVNRYGSHRAYYNINYDESLEQMWKGLPDYVNGNSNILVVRDGSGSMMSPLGNTQITALDVSTALSIYFSERQTGQFKDKFITFSSRPEFIDLSNMADLYSKINYCNKFDDCSNTNIEATFDLILKVAVKNNLKQEEIPDILVISDMEFDAVTYRVNNDALFETIAKRWKQHGYTLPKLIFWNVNSRTNTIPLTENENGVTLVSGFSPAIVKTVLNGEVDPYNAIVKEITSTRYARIKL